MEGKSYQDDGSGGLMPHPPLSSSSSRRILSRPLHILNLPVGQRDMSTRSPSRIKLIDQDIPQEFQHYHPTEEYVPQAHRPKSSRRSRPNRDHGQISASPRRSPSKRRIRPRSARPSRSSNKSRSRTNIAARRFIYNPHPSIHRIRHGRRTPKRSQNSPSRDDDHDIKKHKRQNSSPAPLQQKLMRLEAINKELRKERRAMQAQLVQADTKFTHLQSELERVKGLMMDRKEREKKIRPASTKAAALTIQMTIKEKTIKKQQLAIKQYEQQEQEHTKQMAKLRSNIAKLKLIISKHENSSELAEAKTEIMKLSGEKKTLETSENELKQTIRELQKQNREKEEALAAAVQKEQDLAQMISSRLSKDAERRKKEAKEREKEKEKKTQWWLKKEQDRTEKHEESMALVAKENEKLKQQVSEIKIQLEESGKEISHLKEIIAGHETEITNLTQQSRNKNSQLQDLQVQLNQVTNTHHVDLRKSESPGSSSTSCLSSSSSAAVAASSTPPSTETNAEELKDNTEIKEKKKPTEKFDMGSAVTQVMIRKGSSQPSDGGGSKTVNFDESQNKVTEIPSSSSSSSSSPSALLTKQPSFNRPITRNTWKRIKKLVGHAENDHNIIEQVIGAQGSDSSGEELNILANAIGVSLVGTAEEEQEMENKMKRKWRISDDLSVQDRFNFQKNGQLSPVDKVFGALHDYEAEKKEHEQELIESIPEEERLSVTVKIFCTNLIDRWQRLDSQNGIPNAMVALFVRHHGLHNWELVQESPILEGEGNPQWDTIFSCTVNVRDDIRFTVYDVDFYPAVPEDILGSADISMRQLARACTESFKTAGHLSFAISHETDRKLNYRLHKNHALLHLQLQDYDRGGYI